MGTQSATLKWEMGKKAILNAARKEHTSENENQDLSLFANNNMKLIIIGCTSTNTHTNTNTDTYANQHTYRVSQKKLSLVKISSGWWKIVKEFLTNPVALLF